MPNWWHDLAWVLSLRNEAITPLFIGLSTVGTLYGYLLFILLLAWMWRADFIHHFLPWIGVSTISNNWLKLYFADPRPDEQWWISGYSASGFGLPSGHAQTAVLFWGAIAYGLHRYEGWRWRLVFPILLSLLIGLSRNYLGVHDFQDVIIGNFIGALLLLLFLFCEKWQVKSHSLHVLIVFYAFAVAAFATWPRDTPLHVVIPALALMTGWYGTRVLLMSKPLLLHGDFSQKLLLTVIGLAIVFLLHTGISLLLTGWQALSVLLFGIGVLACFWPQLSRAGMVNS
jgi:glycerophosphoryl diester phosphodiesterase